MTHIVFVAIYFFRVKIYEPLEIAKFRTKLDSGNRKVSTKKQQVVFENILKLFSGDNFQCKKVNL